MTIVNIVSIENIVNKINDIPEIRAEFLLNYLYPEVGGKWTVQNEGTFYRNYNSDLLSVDDEKTIAQTVRDSFIKLLPQGIITLSTDLKGEDAAEKYKQLQLKLRLLREAFKPIDSFKFRDSMLIEQQTDALLQEKLSHVLSTYFGIDIDKIENHYVREAATLLPYVSKRRGDFGFVADLLKVLFKCEVNVSTGRYSHTDSTRRWLPMVRFELLISGLSPEKYRELTEEIKPLKEFIEEWFIPVEVWCRIDIKEHRVQQQTNTRLALGYNTEL